MKRLVKVVLVLFLIFGLGIFSTKNIHADVCDNIPAGQKPPATCP